MTTQRKTVDAHEATTVQANRWVFKTLVDTAKILAVDSDVSQNLRKDARRSSEIVARQVYSDEGGLSEIVCGCGDYRVYVPRQQNPEGIDVVCPECGNHFGYEKENRNDSDLTPADPEDVKDAFRSEKEHADEEE